jgi:hypothetical protein
MMRIIAAVILTQLNGEKAVMLWPEPSVTVSAVRSGSVTARGRKTGRAGSGH